MTQVLACRAISSRNLLHSPSAMAFRWGYCGGKATVLSRHSMRTMATSAACHQLPLGHEAAIVPSTGGRAAARHGWLHMDPCVPLPFPPGQQDPPPPGTWGGCSGRSGCRAEGRRCCSAASRAPPSLPQTSSPRGEGRNCKDGGRGAEGGGREGRRGDLSFWTRCSCATCVLSLFLCPCHLTLPNLSHG